MLVALLLSARDNQDQVHFSIVQVSD